MTHRGYDGYIAIPEWDGQEWRPVDMSGDYPGITWLPGVDPDTFPRPLYQLGQQVRFPWGHNEVWTGDVRRIHLGGGAYYGSAERAAKERYYDRQNMHYTIYARGHGRWMLEHDILGGA